MICEKRYQMNKRRAHFHVLDRSEKNMKILKHHSHLSRR